MKIATPKFLFVLSVWCMRAHVLVWGLIQQDDAVYHKKNNSNLLLRQEQEQQEGGVVIPNHNDDNFKRACLAIKKLMLVSTTSAGDDSLLNKKKSETKSSPRHLIRGMKNQDNHINNHDEYSNSSRNLKKNSFLKYKCTKLVALKKKWQNWSTDVSNFTPIYRPKTDKQLRKIIRRSKRYGCKIRMMGATHSQDGMVTQRKEEDVVIISLASHSTRRKKWKDSIHPESSTFVIGAGKSWYDVSALIRPHGYVLNARTAGAHFSVGGVISNMVHGGGRSTGFVHDDVVKMLVLTSSAKFTEVEGEDLKYWRSSLGQLGIILAVEMKMHSEAIPFVAGIDPSTGNPILDLEAGGLNMERESTLFEPPQDENDFVRFISEVTSKIYQTHATYDSAQFFFNFYDNNLREYRTNFAGPRFSGAKGDFPNQARSEQYEASTKANQNRFSDVAFTGGEIQELNEEIICELFCIPPSGPTGNGDPCIPIPSTLFENMKLCEVPLEVGAAMSTTSLDFLDSSWDAISSSSNDGYIVEASTNFENSFIIVPARALASVFATWYGLVGESVSGGLPGINYFPNNCLEIRFINPEETAVLNPTPTIEDMKTAFNEKYSQFYGGQNAFDLLIPPLPEGISDGLVTFEVISLRNVYSDDVSKFFAALEELFGSMPTNPLLPYSEIIVKECDAINGVFPCIGPPENGVKCCNPPIPTSPVHFGKGWGYGVDPFTTPTTGKMQPFQNIEAISNLYTIGSKQNSISEFNSKRAELDADVFSGGAIMHWLDPSFPNSEFEARKLDGQICGSPAFSTDPGKECLSDECIDSICSGI